MVDRTTLLLIHRKTCTGRRDEMVHALSEGGACTIALWLVDSAPYWAILAVCKLLGDWLPIMSPFGGNREWRVNGVLHRIHGPAIIRKNGTQLWHRNGELHRDGDLPAIIGADGGQEWWRYGALHRDGDAPAVITSDGTQFWFRHGRQHRGGDMPAVVFIDGTQWWYRNGKPHRDEDKPALIDTIYGTREWWRDGTRYR